MLGWLYQLLLSFLAQLLSWFGLSFGKSLPVEQQEQEQEQQQQQQQQDEPLNPQENVAPQPYASDEPLQALP
jgi:hemolysin activation/secretion protein